MNCKKLFDISRKHEKRILSLDKINDFINVLCILLNTHELRSTEFDFVQPFLTIKGKINKRIKKV